MAPNNPIKDVRLSFACDKNFDAMTPCGTGRHCEACNKVVIDFTNKTMADFEAALEQNAEVCGHFHISQLAAVTIPNNWMSRIAATMALIVGLGATVDTLEAQKAWHKPKHKKYNALDLSLSGYIYNPSKDTLRNNDSLGEANGQLIYSSLSQLDSALMKEHPAFLENVRASIMVLFSLDEAGRLFDIVIKESSDPELDASVLVLLTSLCLGGIENEEDFDPNKRYAYQLNIDNGHIVP